MNAEKLNSLTKLLLQSEAGNNVQAILDQLANEIRQLISNPQHPPFQTQVANSLERLRTTYLSLASSFSPTQVDRLQEIGAKAYFVDDIPGEVSRAIVENPATLAVAVEKIDQIRKLRAEYLASAKELSTRLDSVGIRPETLEPGTTEIDVLIPRNLFENRFDHLIRELRTVNRIVRAFSEVATGSAEIITVGQISTTSPIFSLLLNPGTAAIVAVAVQWALNTWKQVEEIRKVRAETAKIQTFKPAEVEEFFDKKVQSYLEESVEREVTRLLADRATKDGRPQEQRTDLSWALNSVLSRVERGMTIEVRFLPPAKVENEDENTKKIDAIFNTIRDVSPQLKFPPPDPSPIMKLPPAEPPQPQKGDEA